MLAPNSMYPTTHVNTSIDNSSVVRQLQAFLLGYPPKQAYPHDADIISHLRWLWTQLPHFQHKVSWVKAYQDDKTSFCLLDLPAQLNICADAMATEYSTNATLPSNVLTSQPAGFPSANVCLLINSQSITAQYLASIRFHINGTKHRAHLQQTQPAWKSDRVWDSNSILHSTTIPLCELRESSVNSQIQSLDNQQQDFAVLDQVIFDTPLEAMLQRPLRSKKHWICLAKQYHPSTHDRKTGNQLLITGFFPKAADIRQPRPNCLHKRPQPQRTQPSKKKQPFARSYNPNCQQQFQLAPF
jgi:hypothetical protein